MLGSSIFDEATISDGIICAKNRGLSQWIELIIVAACTLL